MPSPKNYVLKVLFYFAFIGIIFLSSNSQAQEGGSVKGKIAVPGKLHPQDTVVYIDHKFQKEFPAPVNPVVIDQINMEFSPYVIPILAGTTVSFPNNDNLFHNVFSPSKAAGEKDLNGMMDLGIYPKGKTREKKFTQTGVVTLLCNMHHNMEAYIVILDNPYFGNPDEKGNFTIENIPAGEYTLKVWSKRYKAPPQKIKIETDREITVNFYLK